MPRVNEIIALIPAIHPAPQAELVLSQLMAAEHGHLAAQLSALLHGEPRAAHSAIVAADVDWARPVSELPPEQRLDLKGASAEDQQAMLKAMGLDACALQDRLGGPEHPMGAGGVPATTASCAGAPAISPRCTPPRSPSVCLQHTLGPAVLVLPDDGVGQVSGPSGMELGAGAGLPPLSVEASPSHVLSRVGSGVVPVPMWMYPTAVHNTPQGPKRPGSGSGGEQDKQAARCAWVVGECTDVACG